MPVRVLCSLMVAAGLLAAAGCGPGKLDENKTFTLEPGTPKPFILNIQPVPQKITVEVESSNELDLFVVEEKKRDVFENLMPAKQVEAAMVSKTGIKSGSLVVDVPAKAEVAVVVANAKKKCDVKLHITNQK